MYCPPTQFDLFFEGSQKSDNTSTGSKRTIQIQHLRNVAKLAGEKTKLKDEDVRSPPLELSKSSSDLTFPITCSVVGNAGICREKWGCR